VCVCVFVLVCVRAGVHASVRWIRCVYIFICICTCKYICMGCVCIFICTCTCKYICMEPCFHRPGNTPVLQFDVLQFDWTCSTKVVCTDWFCQTRSHSIPVAIDCICPYVFVYVHVYLYMHTYTKFTCD